MEEIKKVKAFLDSSVLVEILRGKLEYSKLISNEFLKKIQYAINPIVVQEIMLIAIRYENNLNVDILGEVIKILPLDTNNIGIIPDELKKLRNFVVHSNDILILETAENECDYMLTLDQDFLSIKSLNNLQIVTPENFIKEMEGLQ